MRTLFESYSLLPKTSYEQIVLKSAEEALIVQKLVEKITIGESTLKVQRHLIMAS